MMGETINFHLGAWPLATGSTPLKDMSEAELLATHPILAGAAVGLFALGLLCDIYLLIRLILSQRRPESASPFTFKITSKPWGILEIAVGGAAMCAIFACGSLIYTLVTSRYGEHSTISTSVALSSDIILKSFFLAGFALFVRRRQIDWREAFGLCAVSRARLLATGVVLYLAAVPPLAYAFAIYNRLSARFHWDTSPQPIVSILVETDSTFLILLTVALAVIVAPVFEEFFFRGFAYPALKYRMGIWPAIAIVSALFATVHFHLPSIVPLFVLAVALVLAYEWTGSILVPVTMHAVFNLTNLGLLLYVRYHS